MAKTRTMKKRKKVVRMKKTGIQIWDEGHALAKKRHPTWDEADYNVYAYGYERGYYAAVRELTKKARRK